MYLRINNLYRFIILLFLSGTGCTQEEFFNLPSNRGNVIQFSAQESPGEITTYSQTYENNDSIFINVTHIGKKKWTTQPSPKSKTSWGVTGGSTQWVGGDAVGIYMRRSNGTADAKIDRSNIQYVISGNSNNSSLTTSVSPPISFPVSPADYVDFLAYYPYSWVPQASEMVLSIVKFPTQQSVSSLNLNYTIPNNQTALSALRNSDLMYASAKSKNNSSLNVPLTFNHALTLLTFNITSNDFNGITLTRLALSGSKVTNSGAFNLANSQLTSNTTAFSPYKLLNQTLNNSTPVYSDLIINPCAVNGTNSDMLLSLTIGNINYTCPIPANTFLAGYRYSININIKNTQGNNIIVNVGNGGQVQIGQTLIPSGGKGSFNNSNYALSANLTAQSGWVPYAIITDGGAPVVLSPAAQSYTITQNSVRSSLTILFQPATWYPANGLLLHFDGIYSGGYGISNANISQNNTWIDLSGNSRNGTLGNFNFNTSSGWVNNSLKFDGSNDAVSYSGYITNTFTMNLVINISDIAQNANARITAESDYPCFVLTSSGTLAVKTTAILILPVITNFGSGYTPAKNQRLQLTMTCSNRNVRLYVNGNYFGTAAVSSSSFPASSSSALLGAAGGLLSILIGSPLKADYHSFMIYNRVLTDTEILAVYNFNKTRFNM